MALTLSEVKFWEAMGEEITIHMALFFWHLKIALPNFRGIPTNASIIFLTFRATNSRSSDLKCKFVSHRDLVLILNFPRAFIAPPPQTIVHSSHKRTIVMWSPKPGVTYFFKELHFHDRGRLVLSVGFVEIYFTGCLNLNYFAWRAAELLWLILLQMWPCILYMYV